MITIRYLATGDSYRSLQYIFCVPHNTISTIMPEVCAAIYKIEWRQNAYDYNLLWNFPNCIGAVDGKHVVMNAPPKSDSIFYNYEGSHSIVLMGVASLCEGLFENNLNLPPDLPLPQRDTPVPYLMVGDDAFAMSKRLLKHFSQRNLSGIERIFNYRFSRALRVLENAFGILSARFRVMRNPIALNPGKTRMLTAACCAVHNFLIMRKSNYVTPNLVDREACDGAIIPGEWKNNTERNAFFNLGACRSYMGNDAKQIRNEFADYFVREVELSFQYNHI